MIVGGIPHTATDLLGTLLRDVMSKVSQTEGTQPERVVLTHPANWGPFRRGLFEKVPHIAGLASVVMLTEPEAAAAHYAATRNLAEGEVIAVYDLGGGTFDATVLRNRADGLEILGNPEGIERLGGVDFDQALLNYVNYNSDGALSELDIRDPQTVIALARLRQDCVLIKEALSIDNETVMPVFLPGRHFDVSIRRSEFEDLIRAPIESTIGALSRALHSAGVTPAQLSAVLLVGGSSRIPMVAQMVSEELGRPTVVDTHPKYAVALGAATLARNVARDPHLLDTGTARTVTGQGPSNGAHSRVHHSQTKAAQTSVTMTQLAPPAPMLELFQLTPGDADVDPADSRTGDGRPGLSWLSVGRRLRLKSGSGGFSRTALGAAASVAAGVLVGVYLGVHGHLLPSQASVSTTATASAPTEPPPPVTVTGLISVLNADAGRAGPDGAELAAELNQVGTSSGEVRRQAALAVLHLADTGHLSPDYARAATTSVAPFTQLNTPAAMVEDLNANPAAAGPNAHYVLNCMKEFASQTPDQQKDEAGEILKKLPIWAAHGGIRADVATAAQQIATPVAQGAKVFNSEETRPR
ncbi:MAG: Hsp70 family protein [Actinomycetota bacterium]|nr:Hsp70 family protein [Actinomycetota bacterium]